MMGIDIHIIIDRSDKMKDELMRDYISLASRLMSTGYYTKMYICYKDSIINGQEGHH